MEGKFTLRRGVIMIGFVYLKKDKSIIDVVEDVIEYKFGFLKGKDKELNGINEVYAGILVTDSPFSKNELETLVILPEGLTDIKAQLIKPTIAEQNQRIADLELMLAEMITL